MRPKLAAILFQLPPIALSEVNLERMLNNLKLLAALLPKRIKIVFEFRHQSWACEAIYSLFKKNNWCFCIIHTNNETGWAGDVESGFFPKFSKFWHTATWGCYIRFHGSQGPYYGRYEQAILKSLVKNLEQCKRKNRVVFVAFNNTAYTLPVAAIINAKELQKIL